MNAKKTIFLSLILLESLFATNTTEATDYLNQLRQKAGMIDIIADEDLGVAAQNHSDYMKEDNTFSHYETNKNNSHYTGETPGDRLRYINYDFTSYNENINLGDESITSSIDGLFRAIYHRFDSYFTSL